MIRARDRFSYAEWVRDYLADLGKPAECILPLDELHGTTARDLMGAHDGTYSSGAKLGQRPLTKGGRRSVDLSADGAYVTIPQSDALAPGSGDYTLLVWWEWDGDDTGQQTVVDYTGGENVQVYAANGLFAGRIWDKNADLGEATASIYPPAPRAVLQAVVADNTAETVTVYANDSAVTSQVSSDIGTVTPGFDFFLGEAGGGGDPVHGRLGMVAIVPHALTAAELRRIYAVGREGAHLTDDAAYAAWKRRDDDLGTLDDVYLLAGQSNSIGFATYDQWDRDHLHKSLGYHEADRVWRPLDTTVSPRIFRESAWPLVAETHGRHTSRSIGWIQTSKGSSSVSVWAGPGTTYYDRMISTAQDAIADGNFDQIDAVLWYQGEDDAQSGMTQATYEGHLNAFVDGVWNDLGLETLVCRVHNWDAVSDANHQTIVDAQNAVIASNDHALPGADQSGVELPGIHYQSDAEMAQLADAWWDALESLYY